MQNAITELEELTLTSASKRFLRETSKWCKFLSILGFIFIGLMFVASLGIGTTFNQALALQGLPEEFATYGIIVYVIITALYFFPFYYLFQFSVKLKKALLSKDDLVLAKAFEMLKSHYKFIGVFTIIFISIYILIIVTAVIFTANAAATL